MILYKFFDQAMSCTKYLIPLYIVGIISCVAKSILFFVFIRKRIERKYLSSTLLKKYLIPLDILGRQKGLRLDPVHNKLKKSYFGLKNLPKNTKKKKM